MQLRFASTALLVACFALMLVHGVEASVRAPTWPRLRSFAAPTAAVLIHETFVNKAVAAVIPVVEDGVAKLKPLNLTLLGFTFTNLKVSQFSLGDPAIVFVAPNTVQITFSGVNIVIPTTACSTVNCTGTFSATVQGAAMQLNVTFGRFANNGTGVVTSASGTATFPANGLSVSLSSVTNFGCILDWGGVSVALKAILEGYLGKIAAVAVEVIGNDAFAKLPLRFAADPSITPSGFETVIDLHPSAQAVTVPLPPFTCINKRDIEVRITEDSINGLLAVMTPNGTVPLPSRFNTSTQSLAHVWPQLASLCTTGAECPMALGYLLTTPANVSLVDESVTISAENVVVTVGVVDGKAVVPAVVVSATLVVVVSNITVLGANQSVVDFKIGFPTIDGQLISSAIGPIGNFQFYVTLLRVLLQGVVATAINDAFKGLPLKPLDNLIVSVHDHKIDLGIDVQL